MTLKEELEILRGAPIRVNVVDPMDIPCIETSDSEKLCKNPVVSVHMITYNHEPYIRQAIEGVMMQKTDFEFELVIGEDCSTDNTREICFEYQKRFPDKIRVLWADVNVAKLGGNSRRVSARCRGEFIAFCEGDDYWTEPYKLQRQVDFLKTHPEYSAHCENGTILFEPSNTTRLFNDDDDRDYTIRELAQKRRFPTAGVVARTQLAQKLIYASDEIFDTYRWCYFASVGKLRYCSVDSSVYRRGPQGITESTPRLKWARTVERWQLSLLRRWPEEVDKSSCWKTIRHDYMVAISDGIRKRSLPLIASAVIGAGRYGMFETIRDIGRILINGISRRVKSLIHYQDICFCLHNCPPVLRMGVSSVGRSPRLIVSLTSYPARINMVHRVLSSLMHQSMKPDKIVLWLGEDQFPQKERALPWRLLRLRKYGLTIGWCRDMGPHTKLIPSLKEFPDDIIVTADDDQLYGREWLQRLYSSYLEQPRCVHGHVVRLIPDAVDGKVPTYMTWSHNSTSGDISSRNFALGYGGVLYPPHSLDSRVFDVDAFRKLSPAADDIWFWAMTVLNNVSIRVVSCRMYPCEDPRSNQRMALRNDNIFNECKNDSQFAAVVAEFGLSSRIGNLETI